MTFDQIRSFYLIAQLGTFGQAAQRLNTTQPTISARIAALEEHLGVALFDRSGHRAALTPQGRRFLRSAEKMLEIQSEILAETGQGKLSGVLRIGASDTMAMTWIPGYLAAMRESYPEAIFELSIGPSFQMRNELVERELDVAFMVGPVSDPDVVNHALCACSMVMVAPPQMRLHGRPITPGELAGFNLVTFERVTRPYQDLIKDLRAIEITPRVNPVNSLQVIVMMVLKGFGVGVLPLSTVSAELARGDLKLLDVPFQLTDVSFAACYAQGPDSHAASLLTGKAQDWLKEQGEMAGIKLLY